MKNQNALYWVTILSACTMGETAGDFLSFGMSLGYGLSSIILIALLIVVLILEAKAKVQNEARYWTTIVVMSTTGTAMADFLTRTLKLGYGGGSTLLTAVFVVIYFIGQKTKKTKTTSVETPIPHIKINNQVKSLPETDALYWAAILVASTFGTTMGDFVADVLGFGFAMGTIFLGSLLLIVLFFEFKAKVTNKPRYWTALVITSTIGATFGDFLTKEDGLNLGYARGMAIVVGAFVLIYLIGRTRKLASVLPHVDLE
jgi:uncharacterized membrane-anchored protein